MEDFVEIYQKETGQKATWKQPIFDKEYGRYFKLNYKYNYTCWLERKLLESNKKLKNFLIALECENIDDLITKDPEFFKSFGKLMSMAIKKRMFI